MFDFILFLIFGYLLVGFFLWMFLYINKGEEVIKNILEIYFENVYVQKLPFEVFLFVSVFMYCICWLPALIEASKE